MTDSIDRGSVEAATIDAGMLLVLHRGGLRREECVRLLFRRRMFNDILSDRYRMFRKMLAPVITEEMDEGLIFIALLAAMLRWRLETRLSRMKGWSGESLDGLPILLGTITLAVGPGRKRDALGIVHGQRSILTALDCMPEQVIPGCRTRLSGSTKTVSPGGGTGTLSGRGH
jgi:hypothetical protein